MLGGCAAAMQGRRRDRSGRGGALGARLPRAGDREQSTGGPRPRGVALGRSGPFGVDIQSPGRGRVRRAVPAGVLSRQTRAVAEKIEIIERGSDMVLAAHRTPVRGRLVAETVETVRFTRPDRVGLPSHPRTPCRTSWSNSRQTEPPTAPGSSTPASSGPTSGPWARAGGRLVAGPLGTHGPGDVRRGQGRSRTPQPRAGEGHPPLHGRQGAGRRVRPLRCGARAGRCRARRRRAGRSARARPRVRYPAEWCSARLARFSGKIEVCSVHIPASSASMTCVCSRVFPTPRPRAAVARRRPRSPRHRRSSRGRRPASPRSSRRPRRRSRRPSDLGQPLGPQLRGGRGPRSRRSRCGWPCPRRRSPGPRASPASAPGRDVGGQVRRGSTAGRRACP